MSKKKPLKFVNYDIIMNYNCLLFVCEFLKTTVIHVLNDYFGIIVSGSQQCRFYTVYALLHNV